MYRIQVNSKENIIVKCLFFYWFILVLWQNLSGEESKTIASIFVKIILIIFLILSFILKFKGKLNNILYIFLFFICTLPAFFMEASYSLNIVIYYFFSWLFIFLVYGIGSDYKVDVKTYIWFLNALILTIFYAAIHALIFYYDKFINAFYISGAYGNELSSFFLSSHEYGMYLSASIISCIICLELSENKKWKYIFALFILIPNLVLTYSRTAIFSTIIFFIIYILFSNKKIKRILLGLTSIVVIIFIFSNTLQDFLFNIVGKKGNVAGRDILVKIAMDYYKNASFFKQLFGSGIELVRSTLSNLTTHENTHNAYIQILLYFGVINLIWMLNFLLVIILHRWRLYKKNPFWGKKFLSIGIWCMALMIANTHLIFTSPIDCYFLTIFAIIIPKYVINYLQFPKKLKNNLKREYKWKKN